MSLPCYNAVDKETIFAARAAGCGWELAQGRDCEGFFGNMSDWYENFWGAAPQSKTGFPYGKAKWE